MFKTTLLLFVVLVVQQVVCARILDDSFELEEEALAGRSLLAPAMEEAGRMTSVDLEEGMEEEERQWYRRIMCRRCRRRCRRMCRPFMNDDLDF